MKAIKMFLLVASMTVLASCGTKTQTETQNESEATAQQADEHGFLVKIGDEAPDFTAKTITGETVKLSDFRGKVVMLQFTASWCRVCREEMPHIEKEIWQQHKDNPNFVLFAVDRDEPIEKATHMVETIGITYPVVLDPNAEIFTKYALAEAGVTRNVLIDEKGKVIYLTRLFDPAEFRNFVKFIDEHVN